MQLSSMGLPPTAKNQLGSCTSVNFRKSEIFAPAQVRSPPFRNPTVIKLKLQLLHSASKHFWPVFGSIHTVTKYFSKGTDSPAFQRAVLCSLFELNALANLWDSSRQSRSLKSCCDVRKRYIPWSCVSTWTSKSTASLYWKKRKRKKRFEVKTHNCLQQAPVITQSYPVYICTCT